MYPFILYILYKIIKKIENEILIKKKKEKKIFNLNEEINLLIYNDMYYNI